MAKGSCLCGQLKYEFSGEPTRKVACHCLECRKISSSAFTVNLQVPRDAIKMDGTAKKYTFKQELGDTFTISFCGECGTHICKEIELARFKDFVIVEGGTLDEGFDGTKPDAEFFTKYRASWLTVVDGAAQLETIPAT